MQPSITGVPDNILVTAGDVVLEDDLGNQTDLGFVSKISVNIKELTTTVHTDQAGKSPVDDRYVGNEIAVEMEIDELIAQRMAEAFGMGALIGSGSTFRVAWGRNIGASYYSKAKKIIVRPTVDDVAFTGRNFVFYKAAPIGDGKIAMHPDNKAVVKTMFRVYPNFNKPNNEYFGFFGDISAGTFAPASAPSAGTPGGGNVGNGTLGTVSVNDTFTKTETWTSTCIKTGSPALFSVTGSVTGSRGNATTGSAYHSNSITPANSEVNFTIVQGGTPFAIGDTFTLSTTAANYS